MSDRKQESALADLSNQPATQAAPGADGGASAAGAANPPKDARKPYEPPRIVKRRSVAQATLFSNMGPTSVAQTMIGN